MEWISVEDRLPEDDFESYLVCAKHRHDPFIATFIDGKFEYNDPIICWMPIPKKPKQSDEETTKTCATCKHFRQCNNSKVGKCEKLSVNGNNLILIDDSALDAYVLIDFCCIFHEQEQILAYTQSLYDYEDGRGVTYRLDPVDNLQIGWNTLAETFIKPIGTHNGKPVYPDLDLLKLLD